MTHPAVEPYRMIEPQTFTGEELEAVRWQRVPSLSQVLDYAAWYMFCMAVTYLVIFICTR